MSLIKMFFCNFYFFHMWPQTVASLQHVMVDGVGLLPS
jgi:hypothetical protein